MSKWRNPEEWAALIDGTECPVCRRGRPLDVLCELEAGWVTLTERAPMRGYACLVHKRHVIELYELNSAEGPTFLRDAQRLSRAIAAVTGAVKLNYEVHGNTLPHLHLHVFPRYRDDPFEGRPIDPRAIVEPVYAAGEFEELRRRLAAELER